MKLSEKLLIVANWLEDSENDLLVNAEHDENCLAVVAETLVKASAVIKEGAAALGELEPNWTPEKLEELAAVANAFDQSDDELLQKQASVLDEILLTFAAPKNSFINFNQMQNDRIEELKKKYEGPKEKQDVMNKASDAIKDIEKSPAYNKDHRILSEPLSTRHCPEHYGVSIMRVGENVYQCPLNKKVYDFAAGYKLEDGTIVPGSDVSNQTKSMENNNTYTVFDSRNSRIGQE